MLILFISISIIFMAIGLPLFASLGFSGLIYILAKGIPPAIVIQNLFSGVDKTALLAIPFFILSGDLMNRGGLAKRLVRMANAFIGDRTGGLAITSIMGCMFFAAVSGSGPATAAAIGSIMIPAMVNNGYDRNFASTVIAAASPMGIIIPPSIAFVVYGTLSGASISDMYKAGFPAGILMGIMLMITAYFLCKKRGYKGDAEAARITGTERSKEKISATLGALWALGMPIIIVGGVFGGLFTPTESAVAAVVYALFVGMLIYKELKWRDLPKIFLDSAKSTTSIMLIMSNAAIFAYVLTYEKVPQMALETMLGLSNNKYLIMLIINLILLFMGCFLEAATIQNITVPIFKPLMLAMGVDLVHFGMIMCCNMAIGMLTPPFGICLFTAARTGGSSIQAISRACLPFLAALIFITLLITFIPQLIMFAV